MYRRRRFKRKTVELRKYISPVNGNIQKIEAEDCLIIGPIAIFAWPELLETNRFVGEPEQILTRDFGVDETFFVLSSEFKFCTFKDVQLYVHPSDDHDYSRFLVTAPA